MENAPMPLPDEDDLLFARAQNGDSVAFGEWIGRNYTFIYRLAYRMLGNKMDAEDLTHDVCLALPAKIGSFRGESKLARLGFGLAKAQRKGSVRGWLAQVVLNAGRDRLRAQKRRATVGIDACVETGQQGNAVDRLYLQQVLAMMDTMSPKSRDALLLAAEGLTQAEIAVALGCAEGTVAWRVSTARGELAKLMNEQDVVSGRSATGTNTKGGTAHA